MTAGSVGPSRLPFDARLSAELRRKVWAKQRECWINAWRALPLAPGDAMYVEGYYTGASGVPLVAEHGWLEVDGRIVDPTIPPGARATYFPVRRFTPREAYEGAAERGELPLSIEVYEMPTAQEEWRRVRVAADVWAYGRDAARWMWTQHTRGAPEDVLEVLELAPDPHVVDRARRKPHDRGEDESEHHEEETA